MSLARQNFHHDCEAAINQHINHELLNAYVFDAMANYFCRDNVALHGMHEAFSQASNEKRNHADLLMGFLTKRGGRVVQQPIQKPDKAEWMNGLDAMQDALMLEKGLSQNQSLLKLHQLAQAHQDPVLCDFLEEHLLEHYVKTIKNFSDHVTNLKRIGPGLGEQMYDQQLQAQFS